LLTPETIKCVNAISILKTARLSVEQKSKNGLFLELPLRLPAHAGVC
jgi:hypothetical protein